MFIQRWFKDLDQILENTVDFSQMFSFKTELIFQASHDNSFS